MDMAQDFIVRRIPLAAIYRDSLVLGLQCAHCGDKFALDYHRSGFAKEIGGCPKCGEKQTLSRRDVRAALERGFRAAAKRIDRKEVWFWNSVLSCTIARAAKLLEPLLLVAVVRMHWPRIGDMIQVVGGYFRHLETAGQGDALLFTEPPAVWANRILTEKLMERFVVTKAAVPAYFRLLKPMGRMRKLRRRLQELWLRASTRSVPERRYRRYKKSKPFAFAHAVNLYEYDVVNYGAHYGTLAETRKPLWIFSDAEKARADAWLGRHGVEKGRPYACFMGRDHVFIQEKMDWNGRYHDYRDMDIDAYIPAMHWIADQGLTAFRMGTVTKKIVDENRKDIIDFSTLGENEFMDLYLSSNCLLYVTCGVGAAAMRFVQKKWILFCNFWTAYTPAMYTMDNPGLYIAPKKVWSHKKRRFLSLREIFEIEAGKDFYAQAHYNEEYLVLVENSGDDIAAYVQEIYARITGTWVVSDHEKTMQDKYHSLVHDFHPYAVGIASKLSYTYLKRNPYYL